MKWPQNHRGDWVEAIVGFSIFFDIIRPMSGTSKSYLVGGWATPLKNMNVNWDDDSQYMGKKMFQTANQNHIIAFKKLCPSSLWKSSPPRGPERNRSSVPRGSCDFLTSTSSTLEPKAAGTTCHDDWGPGAIPMTKRKPLQYVKDHVCRSVNMGDVIHTKIQYQYAMMIS